VGRGGRATRMVGAFRTVAIGEAQSETDREKGRDKDGKI
jgi:hypothetical protein